MQRCIRSDKCHINIKVEKYCINEEESLVKASRLSLKVM